MTNTIESEGKKWQQQTGRRDKTKKLDKEVDDVDIEEENIIVQDSTSSNSVSKYNFIFYFLYKFKYSQKEEL